MRVVDLIIKKREGNSLTPDEIAFLVKGFSNGEIPDYQTAAFLMAVYFQGMNAEELSSFTEAMINSGEVYDLSGIPLPKVDKHSTGGVGDKTSLVLASAVAACGVVVPMVSGRALGHTGGTLDKLESIPGYRTTLDATEFRRQLEEIGVAIIGQSERFVPADKKLYALRDLTGTVESIPLIAASIMSKKIAAGTESLVMDVKTGNGAFMNDFERARELAKTLVEIGDNMGRQTIALITDMNQPLGFAVGNSLEVIECINTMKGDAPEDLLELTVELGAHMLVLGKITDDMAEARKQITDAIMNGKALEKFRQLIEYQNGNPRVVDDVSLLGVSNQVEPFVAEKSGYISHIDTLKIGIASMTLGAGRTRIDEPITYDVGLRFRKKLSDYVEKGEPICEIYYHNVDELSEAKNLLSQAISISDEKIKPPVLIKATIDKEGTHIIDNNG
ncbi:thymidine phosphorylase [Candidatus Sumerlaeota bacterium]|nr:thymidine phosphorylase [Candidatus Sumerlaeota bacterium]